MKDKSMKVALYARVSKREQVEGYSLDAQLDAMKAYAQSQGWEVAGEYIDPGYPGRTDDRPAFRRLIRDAMYIADSNWPFSASISSPRSE